VEIARITSRSEGTLTVDNVDIFTHASNITTKHLPYQSINSGKYLTANDVNTSWKIATDQNAMK
jgi:hypothetical protein